jgi:hypothetical protein
MKLNPCIRMRVRALTDIMLTHIKLDPCIDLRDRALSDLSTLCAMNLLFSGFHVQYVGRQPQPTYDAQKCNRRTLLFSWLSVMASRTFGRIYVRFSLNCPSEKTIQFK